tara:strand:- start:111 stop:1337 length:1227 start_codon:yes stop_codon:yes gene_type:complete
LKIKKFKVAIFSGNRAEYGLLKPIIKSIKESPYFEYYLVISGAHLEKNFGNTKNEIKNDGFKIFKELKILKNNETNISTPLAISEVIKKYSKVLYNIKPDIALVYADRFEGFGALVASTQMNINTAHIEGGDLTEGGALDDSIRHAMTKLAHIHFTTNHQATKRIILMGEESWRVKTVGFPALDLINAGDYSKLNELKESLKINFNKPTILFTQHSITTEFEKSKYQINQSLKAIKKLLDDNINVIITYPNNDTGGIIIIKEIIKFQKVNKKYKNLIVISSLGRKKYHGILALSKNQRHKIVCVGNSSSGIKETPVFKCPTVNIGTRQDSRLRANNVIDADYSHIDIYKACIKALYNKSFLNNCYKSKNPYGGKHIAKKIHDHLLSYLKTKKNLLRKNNTIKFKPLLK